MRKLVIISAALVGVVVLVIAGLLIYASLNLNSIIQANQALILAKASDALGRQVQANEITASVGWGVGVNIKSVQIADDPRFSQQPFIQVGEISCKVAMLPLLAKKLVIKRLTLEQPVIRVIRNPAGELNVESLGKKGHAQAQTPPSSGPQPQANAPSTSVEQGLMVAKPAKIGSESAALQRIAVNNLAVSGGQIIYQDAAPGSTPIKIGDADLEVEGFNPNSSFNIALKFALLSDVQNFKASGKIGPLLHGDALDPRQVPFAMKMTLGPLTLDRLRGVPQVGPKIPAKLSMPDPVSLQLRADGTVDAVAFEVVADLTSSRIVYLGLFNKPAGMALKVKANGNRRGTALAVSQANLTLADLQAKASNISLDKGAVSAKVDSNRFSLDSLAKTIAAMAKYDASGKAEMHIDAKVVEDKTPDINGTITLAGVSLKPAGAKVPGITDINSTVKLAGNSASIEPTTFTTGGAHGTLEARAESLQPLRATYSLKADDIKVAQFAPKRPADEELRQVSMTGNASQASGPIDVTAQVNSASGLVAGVPYQNLAVSADYAGQRAKIQSLNLSAFGGTIAAIADATLGAQPSFVATLKTQNIDMQQALTAEKAKMADNLRGQMSGEVSVAGRGSDFDEIKPTLQGKGQMAVKNGKLIGINLGAETLQKVKGIPGIDNLITPNVIARHPALFKDRDTQLDQASLSFVLQGPRMTTHDLTVASPDYRMLADGWLDMDKNVDMSAHVLMSKQFSADLRADRKNVVYLEDPDGQIDIPVIIRGQLPKPSILPNIQALAQRATSQLIQKRGSKLIDKFLGGGGGGGSSGSQPSGGGGSKPSNPLDQLKKFF